MGLIKSGYPALSMCHIAAHAAYGGNKPMPQWAFFEVRYLLYNITIIAPPTVSSV